MSSRDRNRPPHRSRLRSRRRRLVAEPLEDRRLLAVSFEFNYLAGDPVGFNHPTDGSTFRAALESAGARLGGWLLDDATVQMDVHSRPFEGSAVATATSERAATTGGGFVHGVVPAKILGLGDANGAASDGHIDVFFFGASDLFTYVTDPLQVGGDDDIDFQAVIIHELVHTLGFTSATTAAGSDDSGNGIASPGTWTPFDQFLSDVDGNRLIDGDPQSPTAFRMNTSAGGWPTHSTGGQGPAGGLFFDGPIANSVFGGRVPLYSPATFFQASSVAHLDSEGFPNPPFEFSPLTHLMSPAIVDNTVPQELTLLEKAILADIGIKLREDVAPTVTPPASISVEGNSIGGFTGSNQDLDDFLNAAVATDVFDPNPTVTHDAPGFLPLGQNIVTFNATDSSGNVGAANSMISVVDTTAPTISVTPTSTTFEATGPNGVTGVTLPFAVTVSDIVDPNPILVFNTGSDFPVGTTTATFTARDAERNTQTFDVDIIVQDTTAPEFTLPAAITIDSNLANGADLSNTDLVDLITAGATDLVDQSLSIEAEPQFFSFGTTSVTFKVTDDSGNAATATTSLTVNDIRFIVTTLDDELDIDPESDLLDLSLREAISVSNARTGADFIRFDPNLHGDVLLDASLGQLEISDSVTLLGLGRDSMSIDAQGNSRVIDVTDTAGDVTIEGLTITGGRLADDSETGAGIRFQSTGTLAIDQSAISGNRTLGTAGVGAGIHIPAGNLVLIDSIVADNGTDGNSSGGGGVWAGGGRLTVARTTFTANSTTANDSAGGGLYVSDSATTIVASTFSGNSTAGSASTGAAIHASRSPLILVNSTVSGNTTQSGSGGGGIYADGGDLDVQSSTITANQAAGEGGGIGINSGASSLSLTIHNSIVAANIDAGTAPDFVGSGVLASATAVEFSLIGDNTGTTLAESPSADPITGNIVGAPNGAGTIDPNLGPLADNGGPTHTHLLLEGSPAVNAGDPAFDPADFSQPLIHDQRGEDFPRVSGRQIDMGSIEVPGEIAINWSNPADIFFGTQLGPDQLNATASVAGVFQYSPPAGTRLQVGQTQMLTATFIPTDLVAFSTTTATAFINVIKADPTITWPQPDPILFGTELDATQLNAKSNAPGTFDYSPPSGTVLDAGDGRVLSVAFTPTDGSSFNSATTSVFIDVAYATPVVTWQSPADVPYETRLGLDQLNAAANVAGTFDYMPPAGVLIGVGLNQTLTVTFTPESPNFEPITETVTINVVKADPVIAWSNPTAIVEGTPLGETQLNASTDVFGTFTYDPPSGTLLTAGEGQSLTATFTPQIQGNYNIVSTTVQIDVVAPQDYGDAPSEYPVTLADDGARHTVTTLVLGSQIDLDIDGNASAAADGDGNDDDGVVQIAELLSVDDTDTIASFAVNATDAGKLDAWIDFNQDDDWDDEGEQVFTSVDVGAGANTFSFTVPAGAMPGSTAARFRLSTNGSLAPTGEAVDGEVEDYLLTILDGGNVSGIAVDLSVEALNGSVEVTVDSNDVVVRSGQTELFRSPVANVPVLNVTGGANSDSVTLDVSAGFAIPSGGFDFRGGLGGNRLAIIGDGGSIDLTHPLLAITDFRNLDLSSGDANTVTIDATAVAILSPALNVLSVIAGPEDKIIVEDANNWRLSDPVISGGRFMLTANNATVGGGESIEADLPHAWQNFLRAGDVNNDGKVTAGDALRIINELARRAFSDDGAPHLVDPLSVASWPGVYFDHNGDDRATALDALRVINDLARQSLTGSSEGEAIVRALIETDSFHPERPEESRPLVDEVRSSGDGDPRPALEPNAEPAERGDLFPAAAEHQRFDNEDSSTAIDHLLADEAFVDQLLPML